MSGKKNSLREWFGQNGGKGWVDCKTGKPCGRQKGEKRKSYPACRPTMSECTSASKKSNISPVAAFASWWQALFLPNQPVGGCWPLINLIIGLSVAQCLMMLSVLSVE